MKPLSAKNTMTAYEASKPAPLLRGPGPSLGFSTISEKCVRSTTIAEAPRSASRCSEMPGEIAG